jgi:two-component system OmpR family response regulator
MLVGMARMIVVVDDDPLIRTLFAAVLQRRGHSVAMAADATEAHSVCARSHPDVVTVDLVMPRGSGLDLIRALRAQPDAPRIVAISGGVDGLRSAKDAGADVALGKPLSASALVDAVEGLLA